MHHLRHIFLSETKIELAEALNISSNYLSQVERGCKSLSLDKMLELAAVLEMTKRNFWTSANCQYSCNFC